MNIIFLLLLIIFILLSNLTVYVYFNNNKKIIYLNYINLFVVPINITYKIKFDENNIRKFLLNIKNNKNNFDLQKDNFKQLFQIIELNNIQLNFGVNDARIYYYVLLIQSYLKSFIDSNYNDVKENYDIYYDDYLYYDIKIKIKVKIYKMLIMIIKMYLTNLKGKKIYGTSN